MKLWTKVVIGDGERGLMYRNRRFERVLVPGVYRFTDALGRVEVRVLDLQRAEFEGKAADALIERLGAAVGIGDLDRPASRRLVERHRVDARFPAAVRLEVECIEAELRDLGAAWGTRSKPVHASED